MVENSELALATRNYWIVSSAFNGRPPEDVEVTVEKGLRVINRTLDCLNPARSISRRLQNLRQNIIHDNMGEEAIAG